MSSTANEKDSLRPSIEEEQRVPATAHHGNIVLIPQPSDDPRDPLRWSLTKKYSLLFVLCLAAFSATTTPSSHQTAYPEVAKTYQKTPQELVYSIDAGVAGLLAGPVIFGPLAQIIGRTSLIFWSLIITAATQIWAGCMQSQGQYISFTISRLFAGLFAAIPTVIGSGFILDVFYLHQRGKAYAFYELALLLGVIASPTIGGFIVAHHGWPWVFWWTLVPLGVSAILVFCFLEDTQYAPGRARPTQSLPTSWLSNRVATFLPGNRTVPRITAKQFCKTSVAPFVIGVAPVTIIAGGFTLILFAWALVIATEVAVFMRKPIAEGGYGFDAVQTASFTFTSWVAVGAAQTFGFFYNDKLPLWASRRNGGVWHPEYRLLSLFPPALLSPIGLGLVGAGLQYHLHEAVVALGWFLMNASSLLTVPVCINYIAECFTGSAVEVAIIMNVYRLALGFSVGFYYEAWGERVGVGWLFGMCAFFSVFAALCVGVLAFKGPVLRQYVFWKEELVKTEEGERVTGAPKPDIEKHGHNKEIG